MRQAERSPERPLDRALDYPKIPANNNVMADAAPPRMAGLPGADRRILRKRLARPGQRADRRP